MWKTDTKHGKLTFEQKNVPALRSQPGTTPAAQDMDEASDQCDVDIKTILLDMKSSLLLIDTKIDHQTACVDLMKDRLDNHGDWLDNAKRRISAIQDDSPTIQATLQRLEKQMSRVAKNEG